MVAHYNELQTSSAKSEKKHVQYRVEKRQSYSRTYGQKTEKTTFYRKPTGLLYDYKDALAKEKRASEALKMLGASVEEVRSHAELFRNMSPIYNDWFKTDLNEGFPTFLTMLRDGTKELVKSRGLRMKNSVDLNFAVIDDMLQAFETELSQLGPYLNSVAYN